MHGNSAGLFVVVVTSVVPEMLLILKCVTSMGCNLPVMVFLGNCTVLFSVLSRGIPQWYNAWWQVVSGIQLV